MAVAVDFSTIPGMFDRITVRYSAGDRPILKQKVDKKSREISYSTTAGELNSSPSVSPRPRR